MKVILLADVQRVGHEGDIIDVADGFLRNYLEPRGLAVKATKGAIKDLENRRQAIERREEAKAVRAGDLAAELRERRILIHAPTGEGTRLHGTVTAQQIAEAAAEQLDFDLDRRDIDIAEPIREIGDYLVSAQIYKGVTAQLSVRVVPLDGGEDEAEEDAVEEDVEEEDVEEEDAEEEDVEEEDVEEEDVEEEDVEEEDAEEEDAEEEDAEEEDVEEEDVEEEDVEEEDAEEAGADEEEK